MKRIVEEMDLDDLIQTDLDLLGEAVEMKVEEICRREDIDLDYVNYWWECTVKIIVEGDGTDEAE